MKPRRTISAFILLLVLPLAVGGQNMTTMGTDFWFSFMEGGHEATTSVTITGLRACTGTVSNPNTGWSQSFNVPANGSVIVNIDSAQCYNLVSGQTSNKGLHLTTTDTVSVYASNFYRTSFDVSFVLPTATLRDEYLVQTFETWRMDNRSQILIVAVVDSTTVTITPTATTENSAASGSYSVALDAGQCYFMKCNEMGDYSGTRIVSADCKPIAVFNGHTCAHIPVTVASYCDHLFEQCLPVGYWGKRFVFTKSEHHNGDYVKVTAARDDCGVNVNGTQVAQLDAGESYAFTVVNTTSCYIETSQPASVYSYMMSKDIAGPDGDPAMTLIAPIEQQLKDVVFVSYNNVNQLTNFHYVNVVAPTSEVGNIYLDNYSLWNDFSIVPANSDYSFARIAVNPGTHRLHSTGEHGFVAHAYGVGANESYGYSVGFTAKLLDKWIVANGNQMFDGDTLAVCIDDSLRCYLKSDYQPDVLGWYSNGQLISTSDTLRRQCGNSGSFKITIRFSIMDMCTPIVDSACFVLKVLDDKFLVVDSVVCDNPIVFSGSLCDSSGTYTFQSHSADGCDSLTTLHLTINHSTTGSIEYEGCDSLSIGGVTYYNSGSVAVDTVANAEGCDSVIIANYTINHSKKQTQNIDILLGDTIVWIDGQQYSDTGSHPQVRLHTVAGCDSIVQLNLNVHYPPTPPPIDSSTLWIPNAFTPDESTNRTFKIFCNDLTFAQVYIFNRWGGFVTAFDGLTQEWDGTKDGKPCKQDVYTYMIEYRVKSMPQILKRKKGTVTLLR